MCFPPTPIHRSVLDLASELRISNNIVQRCFAVSGAQLQRSRSLKLSTDPFLLKGFVGRRL
jgi:hypothetical protein